MEAVEIITDMQVEGRLYARDEMTRRQIRDLLGFSAQINNSTEEILAAPFQLSKHFGDRQDILRHAPCQQSYKPLYVCICGKQ